MIFVCCIFYFSQVSDINKWRGLYRALFACLLACFEFNSHLPVRNALYMVLRELSNPDMVAGPDGASDEEEDLLIQ